MRHWIAWTAAGISTVVCLFLWFRDVRRIMRDKKSMVESAASQLTAHRERAAVSCDTPNMAAILERSESIYAQAVELYHQTLRRKWVRFPAFLMGFRPIPLWEDQPVRTGPVAEHEEASQEPVEEKERYFGSVRFFKNMILLAVIIMIAVPTVLVFCLNENLEETKLDLRQQTVQAELLSQEKDSLQETVQQQEMTIEEVTQMMEDISPHVFRAESPYSHLYPDFYAPQELTTGVREEGTIYLTFDDGPSARTPEVLDILKEKNVKATFFVVGSSGETSEQLLRRIVEEGHTLAMHTYSHNYTKIYASVEDYLADMYQIFTQIKEVTGVTPSLFRFPGGSINGYNRGLYQELISEMLRRGFIPYDWNISSSDAASAQATPAATVLENVVVGASRVHYGIVLMHDSAAKTTTVQALPAMIDRLQEMGFELKALTPECMPILYGYRE